MADPSIPVFRGGSGSDCEEFVRAVYTYAFEKDKTEDNKWMATYAATRLSGNALRWYARQDNSVKMDWSALQVALLDQYPHDEDDVGPNAQLSLTNVPTPAAAAAPSAGVITSTAGSVPVTLTANKVTISECKKARIRVEDNDGIVKGWISTNLDVRLLLGQSAPNSDRALYVKARKVNSGGTELRVLNVKRWSRLCLVWSVPTFGPKDDRQYGHLRPCNKAGIPIELRVFDPPPLGQCSPRVWDLDDAGVITLAWRENGGEKSLCGQMAMGNQAVFYSTQHKAFRCAPENTIKLVYEPID